MWNRTLLAATVQSSAVFASAAILGFALGCGNGAGDSPSAPAPANEPKTMNHFTIGDTDFGIDASYSSCTLDAADPANPKITIKISGDEALFEEKYFADEDEDSEWGWSLHPPTFFLEAFPGKTDQANGQITARVAMDDIDNYEFGVYMMQYHKVDDVSVRIVGDESLEVSGRLLLFDEPHEFSIRWKR